MPASLAYPEHPLQALLRESARKYPNRPCTIVDNAVVRYAELDLLSDQIAAGLVGLGVRSGDQTGVVMPNTPHFVMAFYGILKAGAAVGAINPLFTRVELEHARSTDPAH